MARVCVCRPKVWPMCRINSNSSLNHSMRVARRRSGKWPPASPPSKPTVKALAPMWPPTTTSWWTAPWRWARFGAAASKPAASNTALWWLVRHLRLMANACCATAKRFAKPPSVFGMAILVKATNAQPRGHADGSWARAALGDHPSSPQQVQQLVARLWSVRLWESRPQWIARHQPQQTTHHLW